MSERSGEATPSVVRHLSREEGMRTVDEFFASFVWDPALDPDKTPAESYLAALIEAGRGLGRI